MEHQLQLGDKTLYGYEWPRPNITTDIVYHHPTKGVLLIRRKNEPGKGQLACPGGHLEVPTERVHDCAKREFLEEVGFTPEKPFQLIGVFDKLGRDPRGRYITFVFGVVGSLHDPEPKAGDDASHVEFHAPETVSELDFAMDHKQIVMNALFGSFKEHNLLF